MWLNMELPDHLFKKMSKNKQLAYLAYQNLLKAIDEIDNHHHELQKELSKEFRGYIIQTSSIGAAIIGIIGGLSGFRSGDVILELGLTLIATSVVLGIAYVFMVTQKSARLSQCSYNKIRNGSIKPIRGLVEFMDGDDESDEVLRKAFAPHIAEQKKLREDIKPINIITDDFATLVLVLFGLGVVLITVSFIV